MESVQVKDQTRPSIQFPGVDPDESSRTERRRRGDFHGPGAPGRADRYRPGGRPQPQLIDRGRSKESSREKENAKYLDQEIDRLLSGEGYFQREESQLAHVSDRQSSQPAPRKHQADRGFKHERGLAMIAQVHTESSCIISSIDTPKSGYKAEPQGPLGGTPSPETQRAIVNSRHNQNRDGLMFSPKLPASNAEVSRILGSFGNSPTSTIPTQRMEHRPMAVRPGLSEKLAEKLAKEKQVMEQRNGIKRPREEDLFAAKDDCYDPSEEARMKRIKSDRVAMFALEEDDGYYD